MWDLSILKLSGCMCVVLVQAAFIPLMQWEMLILRLDFACECVLSSQSVAH